MIFLFIVVSSNKCSFRFMLFVIFQNETYRAHEFNKQICLNLYGYLRHKSDQHVAKAYLHLYNPHNDELYLTHSSYVDTLSDIRFLFDNINVVRKVL